MTIPPNTIPDGKTCHYCERLLSVREFAICDDCATERAHERELDEECEARDE